MFEINEDAIKESLNFETYKKGVRCYENDQVENLSVSTHEELGWEKTIIEGRVKSSSQRLIKYDVRITYPNSNCNISCYCNCKAYYNYDAPCKHIAAVLIKYARENSKSERNETESKSVVKKNSKLIQQLKENLISTKAKMETRTLNLKYKLQFNISRRGSEAFLELKVGEEKLYVVKNMKSFLEAVIEHNELEFGKNFTYNSYLHRFKDEDKFILSMLKDIYEIDRATEDMVVYGYHYNKTAKFLSGKKARLTESNLKKFLDNIGETAIDLVINDDNYSEVKVVRENFPLEFKLDSKGNNIILSQVSKLPEALVKSGNYFYYNNEIYMPTNEQVRVYKALYNTFIEQRTSEITFQQSESEEIASYIIPALKKIGTKVTVNNSIKEKFYEEPLKTCLYFDKDKDAVVCDVIFKYGNIDINPLKDNEAREDGKVLVRDIEEEAAIVDTLTAFEFEKGESNFILEDEDKILDFVGEGLEKLQESAEIYYSDAFKDIRIYTSKSYKSNIRLNDEDLLEFTFNIDGVNREELKHIFDALKQKKKYYRLKNGGFIPLQASELQNMSDMIDYLNIKTSDLKKDQIVLSKYNAV